MRAAAPDRLSEMLRLKLTGIRDQLDGLLDEADRQELFRMSLDTARPHREPR